MTTPELLKAFLALPEMCMVGSAQERAAFTALYIERRTVREAGEAFGVSKSQVPNLAGMFQMKLASRIAELARKPVSKEYRELYLALLDQLGKLQEESGSFDEDGWYGGHKIGDFNPSNGSREDRAEATGTLLRDPDEWN